MARAFLAILIFFLCFIQGASAADLLNPAERHWLSQHDGKIILAPDPNYPPIEFFDEQGRYSGISSDYIQLLEKKLKVRFKIRRLPTWHDVIEEGKAHRIDVIPEMQKTPQREKYWLFTSPYIDSPVMILTSKRIQRNLTPGSLQGLRVALVRSYAINEYLAQHYPGLKLIPVPDVLTGLRRLAIGEYDAVIADLPVAIYLIEKEGISGLRIAGDTGYRYQLAFASRKDWPILNSILEKGRKSITPEEWNEIYTKWVNVKALQPFDPRSLLLALGGVLLLAATAFVWGFMLRQQVRARTRELAEKERNYREIYNSTKDAIIIHDARTGDILDVNDAALEMYGYAKDELLRLSLGDISCAEQGCTQEEALRRIREALERGVITFEWCCRKKGGDSFWAEVKLNRTAIGGQERCLAMIRDVMERRRTEEEREKSRAQQRQIEALKEADTLKDQFLGILSHELRSPLNAITGFGSILEDELFGPLNEKQQECLSKMLASAENLLFLVNDLLDMTRIQAGRFSVAFQPIHFPEISEKAVETLRPLAEKKHQEILEEIPSDLPELPADGQRIFQVLINLINNAIKFIPEGGKIRIRAFQEDGSLRCEVEDNGPGIVPEDQLKLFKPFSQLDMSTTRKSGGTGLGLSITKAIVDAHGGQIGVSSVPGKGSTFWFTLPFHRADS